MEHFKIEHFERDNLNQRFPAFKSLQEKESSDIRGRLSQKVGISEDADSLILLNRLYEIAQPVEHLDATAADFNLASVLEHESLKPEEDVYINWYRFDNVDRISLKDLTEYWDDIWYPAADDVEVFDDSLKWMLFIHHSGDVSILRLDESS